VPDDLVVDVAASDYVVDAADDHVGDAADREVYAG
jgi:hypothetical protein